MTVFTFIPASADEVVYVAVGDISPIEFVDSNSLSLRLTATNVSDFTDSSIMFTLMDFTGASNSTIRDSRRITKAELPFDFSPIINNESIYSNPFLVNKVNSIFPITRIVSSFDFGFDYYFKDIDYDFYLILSAPYETPGYEMSYTLNLYFLNSNSDIVNVSYSTSVLGFGTIGTLYEDSNLTGILSDYRTYYSSCIYSDSNYSASVTYPPFYVIKVSVSDSFSDYTNVSSLYFDLTYNLAGAGLNSKKCGFAFNFPGGMSGAYIQSSATQEYIRMLTEVNEKLDVVTGPPSQQQQAAIDQVENQLATEFDELQEQLDIIHSPEMPTELPTEDFSYLEDEASVINNYLGDLNLLNIFNVIVPAGCAGFLIYIVLRRF